jgi:uracil-DNA glycosylase
MTPIQFVSTLQALSFEHTFNPYSSCCPVHDKTDAACKRSKALSDTLMAAATCEIDSIWIGRDLGYRGGRRTGLALTDDIHISAHASRWSVKMERATRGQPVAERTAAVVWGILEQIELPIFLWNVFPLHPHNPDDPFSNRSHTSRERFAGEEILTALILLLRPKRLVAIGTDAAKCLTRVAPNKEIIQVRHPSYGGQREFLTQVQSLYSCRVPPLLNYVR